MKAFVLVLTVLAICLSPLHAGVVIDFESLPGGDPGLAPGPPFLASTQGFDFSSPASFGITDTASSVLITNNGGNVLLDIGGSADPVSMAHGGGLVFDLVSVSSAPGIGIPNDPANATTLNIVGTYFGGGAPTPVTFTLTDGIYSTFALPTGWTNLQSVSFFGTGGGANFIAVDNISVNVVPEPSSIALLATTALGCMYWIRARRKRNA